MKALLERPEGMPEERERPRAARYGDRGAATATTVAIAVIVSDRPRREPAAEAPAPAPPTVEADEPPRD
jgi:hypothetical protein